MKLIYITSGIGSAFNSQVCELLNYYSLKQKEIKEIYLIVQASEQLTICHEQIKIKFIKHYPEYNFVNFFNILEFKKVLKTIEIDNKTIFHTRGHSSAFFLHKALKLLKITNNNILVDVRGAVIEEFLFFKKINPFLKKLKINFFKKTHLAVNKLYFNCVSESLKKYMIDNFNINEEKTIVAHCLVSENFFFQEKERVKIRKELGLKETDICVVFSTGGGSLWQNTENIINSLSKIPNVKLLILSKQDYSQYSHVISKFVDFKDMPKYLSAADIGIINRNDSIVNKVASPIKFSEYLACGLPVLANKSVDIITDMILKYDIGLALEQETEITEQDIHEVLQKNRQKITILAKEKFEISQIAKKYFEQYKKILLDYKNG